MKVLVSAEQNGLVITPPNTVLKLQTVQVRVAVGVPGLPGADGGSVYIHSQSAASSVWTVNHNLGAKPIAEVIDAGSNVVEAEIIHTSNNQLLVYFSAAFTGQVRCL